MKFLAIITGQNQMTLEQIPNYTEKRRHNENGYKKTKTTKNV